MALKLYWVTCTKDERSACSKEGHAVLSHAKNAGGFPYALCFYADGSNTPSYYGQLKTKEEVTAHAKAAGSEIQWMLLPPEDQMLNALKL